MKGLLFTHIALSIVFYILSRIIKGDSLKKANRFTLALLSNILILYYIAVNLLDYFKGYYEEMISFEMNRLGSWFLPKTIIFYLIISLPILNYLKKFRLNGNYQLLVFIATMLLILLEIGLSGVGVHPINAGWDTTSTKLFDFPISSIGFILGLAINIIITKWKLLPELKMDK